MNNKQLCRFIYPQAEFGEFFEDEKHLQRSLLVQLPFISMSLAKSII